MPPASPRGRGAAENPRNRFERLALEVTAPDPDGPAPETLFLRDTSRTIIVQNDSPDIYFNTSINPYRGCEHGCSYCYARPYHEYLGFSAGLDFETKIMVKEEAPELLRRELAKPSYTPEPLGLSGVTDAYQPIEKRLRLTRRCLEILVDCRHPVVVITKNRLVERDADLYAELARFNAVGVLLSLTTLDPTLQQRMEPRTSSVDGRLAAIRSLKAAGVPVGVLTAPVIPGLNDHEVPALLAAAADAGATFASYTLLRLPHGLKELFTDWLERHYPDRKEKVLGRIRDVRGGRLNDPNFKTRMRGEGELADTIRELFDLSRRRVGLARRAPEVTSRHFRRPTPDGGPRQGLLFEDDPAGRA